MRRLPPSGRFGPVAFVSGSGNDVDVEQPFASPSDVKRSEGFGATEADLSRGYLEPGITEAPKYEVANYQDRWIDPKISDVGEDGATVSSDWEFRNQDNRSHGFLTRPNVSTER